MAQKKPSRAIKLFGTEVPNGKRRELRAGPISAVFDSGALRYICYHGEEVLRGIAFIVRDKDWGTYAPAIENLKAAKARMALPSVMRPSATTRIRRSAIPPKSTQGAMEH